MFDFAWSELAVIAVVALIAIGPKDMPVAIKAVTGAIKKARRMASEFQGHVDEMMREADLGEIRDQLNELRSFDVNSAIERTVDPDGSLRSTFADDPLRDVGTTTETAETEAVAVGEHGVAEMERPEDADAFAPASEPLASLEAPPFVPPNLVPHSAEELSVPPPPAFIPPAIAERAPPRAAP